MIVVWNNGCAHEERDLVFLECGVHSLVAVERCLRLVDEGGEIIATTDHITWTTGGETELFLSYVIREAPELVPDTSSHWSDDFQVRLNEVPTETLNVLAARLVEAQRPKDENDRWAHLVIDAWRWRNRPRRRRHAS